MRSTSCASLLAALVLFGDGSVSDKPIEKFRTDLLDLAFKAATAMPVKPHLKNRSRAQEAVVDACFELEQPQRALGYVEKIEDWRRGVGYGEFAYYSASHGGTADVQRYLDLARQIAVKSAEDENSQDWQQERILATIAKTQFCLGQTEAAARNESGLSAPESRPVNAVKAMNADASTIDVQLKAVDTVRAAGGFDQLQSRLEICAHLYDRFYDDPEQRARLEEKIKTSWDKLPTMIRIDLMAELVDHALAHKDQAKALALVEETQVIVESVQWTPEDHVRLMGRLAGLRYRAGDAEKARGDADRALLLFDASRGQIVNIWRAGALRPVAEAYQTMGDSAAALKVYKKAVEEGVGNPNSRPRAEDLSATCCSMALRGVEPDESLRTRLAQICDGLGSPW